VAGLADSLRQAFMIESKGGVAPGGIEQTLHPVQLAHYEQSRGEDLQPYTTIAMLEPSQSLVGNPDARAEIGDRKPPLKASRPPSCRRAA
jgi:hypothetical protein